MTRDAVFEVELVPARRRRLEMSVITAAIELAQLNDLIRKETARIARLSGCDLEEARAKEHEKAHPRAITATAFDCFGENERRTADALDAYEHGHSNVRPVLSWREGLEKVPEYFCRRCGARLAAVERRHRLRRRRGTLVSKITRASRAIGREVFGLTKGADHGAPADR